jgi:hypothetical protein
MHMCRPMIVRIDDDPQSAKPEYRRQTPFYRKFLSGWVYEIEIDGLPVPSALTYNARC